MKVLEFKCALELLAAAALVLITGGCGPYAAAQADLAAQAREGLKRVEAARQAEAAAVSRFLAERRARLDHAFVADVQAQAAAASGGLSPEWVLEAGRGYAAGLDVLAAARARQQAAAAIAADNAAAADEALALLQRMLRAQAQVGGLSRIDGDVVGAMSGSAGGVK